MKEGERERERERVSECVREREREPDEAYLKTDLAAFVFREFDSVVAQIDQALPQPATRFRLAKLPPRSLL